MKKYITVIVIFTLIIIIYFCNNIENFSTDTTNAKTQDATTQDATRCYTRC